MMDRFVGTPKSYKNNKQKQKVKKKKKKSLTEVKQLIELFVCTPSFKHRTKLVASGNMELNFLAFAGKVLRLNYNG